MTRRSLKTRLVVLLSVVIMAIAVVQAAVSYRTAREEANELLDLYIRGIALSLRGSVVDAAAIVDPSAQDSEAEFNVVVQIWDEGGRRVYRSQPPEGLPTLAFSEGYSTVDTSEGHWRVFATQSSGRRIQVAQRMDARRDMATGMAIRALWPILGFAPLLIVAAAWVVGFTLRPVDQTRRTLAEREASDLRPLPLDKMPAELHPLMREFNALLARVATLMEAQRRFVADASHELRSPLTAMKLQVRAVRLAMSDETRLVLLERLEAGLDRGQRLVEQLLVLAREECGVGIHDRESSMSLDDIAREVVAEHAPRAMQRSIDLGVVAPRRMSISADQSSVRSLLHNLVDNAVKYSPRGGTVDVRVDWIDSKPCLIVSDNGPGIPESERARVFDRFYRIAGSEGSGSGIGLAIVAQIAMRLGATVRLTDGQSGGLSVEVRFADPGSSSVSHSRKAIE
ncbi:MAG: ATP-binding protein [Betaproteobacteria bacterium]